MTARSELEAEISDMENQIDDLKTAIQAKRDAIAAIEREAAKFSDAELAIVRRFVMQFRRPRSLGPEKPNIDFDDLRRACCEKFNVEAY